MWNSLLRHGERESKWKIWKTIATSLGIGVLSSYPLVLTFHRLPELLATFGIDDSRSSLATEIKRTTKKIIADLRRQKSRDRLQFDCLPATMHLQSTLWNDERLIGGSRRAIVLEATSVNPSSPSAIASVPTSPPSNLPLATNSSSSNASSALIKPNASPIDSSTMLLLKAMSALTLPPAVPSHQTASPLQSTIEIPEDKERILRYGHPGVIACSWSSAQLVLFRLHADLR